MSDPLLAGRPEARPGSQHPFARLERPHVAARAEDALDRWVARRLVRRGWTVRVQPYTGYGGHGWVRVLARTVLAAPLVADDDLPDSGVAAGLAAGMRPGTLTQPPDDRPQRAVDDDHRLAKVRGWRSFLVAPVAGTRVLVRIGDQVHEVLTDRAGYVDVVLSADLPSGWQHLTLSAGASHDVATPVLIVSPSTTAGVVCDIDDTVMVTRLPRPFIAAWNSFVLRADAREAVPGMADLLRALDARQPASPVVYLSTGAWDTAPSIARFLRVNGFPPGPLLLSDWGPTNTGWFRSGPRHKVEQLRRLFSELPAVRWVLVGDDGQHDPLIYAGAVHRHTEHVGAVMLRQLTFAEHVLSTFSPPAPPSHVRPTHPPVPVLAGPNGHTLLAAARDAGLLDG